MSFVGILLLIAVALFAAAGIRAALLRSFDFVSWGLFFFALAFLVPHLDKAFS